MAKRTALERFTAKYVKKLVVIDGKLLCCWLWQASATKGGYPAFSYDGRMGYAHRWSYEHFVGPIPAGKQLDHYRCWTPLCVNPAHLRPATGVENVRNGRVNNAVKTHCVNGHPFTKANTYLSKQVRNGKVYPQRQCRTCRDRRIKEWNARR